MKKVITSVLTTLVLIGAAQTTVFAEEYEIKKGDNLWDIAEENNTSVEYLLKINDLKSTVIHPKQVILLNDEYKVKKGDSLESIADEYNVTVDEIKEWNDLNSSTIKIGQVLEIKSENTKEVSSQKEQSKKTTKVTKEVKEPAKEESEGKTLTVTATAYTADCEGCSGITYNGTDLNKNPDAKVIAVDPNVIPIGSKVHVEGYGDAIAADIGSAIKGKRIDVFIPNLSKAKQWGTQTVDVKILN